MKILKEGLKDCGRFLQMDVKDIPYQFNVLFPKVPKYGEKERKEIERRVVSLVGGNDGEVSLYLGNYTTSEDIEKMKEELGI